MYTVLTGTPPFMASPLSEMYQNIREGHYPEPAHLSANARRLIVHLLAPNPAERPSLDHLLQDDFFTQGFTPDRLPAHSCHSPPIFAIPPPLGRIFRKVGQRLLTQCRPPCPFTPKEASGPGEGGPDPDSMEWDGESSLSAKEVPCLEGPIHLVAQGTLQSDLAGPEGSRRPEVEAALRHLQLCLDVGPPATQDPLGEQQPILWAPKWVDYSSKYGFGYQLLDGGRTGRHPHGPATPRRVSFSGVPAQLVLSGEGEGLQLTLWEQGSPGTSYSLDVPRSHGCAPTTGQHLHHALRMLQSI
uniref:Isoform 2 of Inactive serine/threonine-protein kinase PLK5 n=1 Tax=Homo sapiens TaxID=9606 RepID=Q496M5-2